MTLELCSECVRKNVPAGVRARSDHRNMCEKHIFEELSVSHHGWYRECIFLHRRLGGRSPNPDKLPKDSGSLFAHLKFEIMHTLQHYLHGKKRSLKADRVQKEPDLTR